MDTYGCIVECRSVRAFSGDDVPRETVLKIVDAGRRAPSARNLQPWHFVIVHGRKQLGELARYCLSGRFVAEASWAVVVVTDPSNKWHEIDGARAVQNMTLAAWNEGVGTCWVGALDREAISAMLGIPPERHVLTVLPLGYPADSPLVPDALRRRPVEDVIWWGTWGVSLPDKSV